MSTIIKLDKVCKAFSRRVILKDVSLSVEAGHTVGIVGSNGSGKSVLFQIICGFLVPDSGIVSVRDQALGNSRDFPENMGVLINSPGFISLDTGLQNLRYLAGIRGVIGDQEIRDAMKKVGLDPEDRTKVEHYSLGMKQKLGLAQAIMEGQDILVLDEPFNALDYQRRTTRNKAQYSLNCDDGIEYSACLHEPTPQELLDRMELFIHLWNALNSLPEMQGVRVEAHLILGKSYRQIAREQGVDKSAVRHSVKSGKAAMRKYLKKFL